MSEQNNELRVLAAQLTDEISKIDMEAEKTFINDLLEAVAVPKARIPEPVFREIFLPYFTGEKEASRNEDAIAHWVGLVGSGTESADVVNVKGEILFEVPPMYDSSRISTVKTDDDTTNLGTIFTVYAEQASVHSALGNKYLGEELAKKTKYFKQDHPEGPTWKPVLEYYGLIKKEPMAGAQVGSGNSDDDLVFDED